MPGMSDSITSKWNARYTYSGASIPAPAEVLSRGEQWLPSTERSIVDSQIQVAGRDESPPRAEQVCALDLACGRAGNAYWLAKKGFTVSAWDISQTVIDEINSRQSAVFADVQVRDVALSGMFFTLFNLGSGAMSIDNRFFKMRKAVNWDVLGLLLRFSLAMVFIVAGFFGGFAKIATFFTPQLLLAAIGLLLIFGNDKVIRAAGLAVVAVMLWYMAQKLNVDKSIISNLNGIKREFALGACGGVLLMLGGGTLFTLPDLISRSKRYIAELRGTNVTTA